MKKMNSNGFTLIELLVAVTILGIITAMSLPIIRNIQEGNDDKKYTTYASTILTSAKIYNNSYGEDLFGHVENGCAYISYEDLSRRKLIKDIQIEGISCNSSSTFVKVVKLDEKYFYSVFMGCGKKVDNKVESVERGYPAKDEVYTMDLVTCSVSKESNLAIQTNPVSATSSGHKKRSLTVKITGSLGINNGSTLFYAWSDKIDVTPSEISSSDWKQLSININNNNLEGQLQLIHSGIPITATSQQITTPEGKNGDLYIIVRVDHLQNIFGVNWTNPTNQSLNYQVFGPYRVENP